MCGDVAGDFDSCEMVLGPTYQITVDALNDGGDNVASIPTTFTLVDSSNDGSGDSTPTDGDGSGSGSGDGSGDSGAVQGERGDLCERCERHHRTQGCLGVWALFGFRASGFCNRDNCHPVCLQTSEAAK